MKIFKLLLLMQFLSQIQNSIILKQQKNKIIPESNKLQLNINRDNNQADIISHTHIESAKLNNFSIPYTNPQDQISLLSHPNHNQNQNQKPLIEINDEEQGLNEMGQIGSRLFKMNPKDLYKDDIEDMGDMDFDLDEALKKSHMKIPVMLSPSVLKSMIYYMEKHDDLNDKMDEKKKVDNELLRNREQYMTEDELAEKETEAQIENNEFDVKNLEHELKNLKKKIKEYKESDEEVPELDSDEEELEKELENKEEKENILEQEEEVQKEIINLQGIENELNGKNLDELEEQKSKLENELKELTKDENNKDKIELIEKEIEQIEKTEAEMDKKNQQQAEEHLEKERDELMEKETELNDESNLDVIKQFEGKFTIKELPDVLRIINDFDVILNKIFKDIPIDLTKYQTAEDDLEKEEEGLIIYTKIEECKREFNYEKKNLRKTIQFLKNKTFEIELTTEGMMSFLNQSGIYSDMRLGAPEKNFDYYEIDKKIRLETDKMTDELRIFMDKLNSIITIIDDIESKIEFFQIEEEQINKNHLGHEEKEEDKKKIMDEKIDLTLEKIDGFANDKEVILKGTGELKMLVNNFKERKNTVFDLIDELQAKIEEHLENEEKKSLEENVYVLKFFYFFGLILLY